MAYILWWTTRRTDSATMLRRFLLSIWFLLEYGEIPSHLFTIPKQSQCNASEGDRRHIPVPFREVPGIRLECDEKSPAINFCYLSQKSTQSGENVTGSSSQYDENVMGYMQPVVLACCSYFPLFPIF